MDYQLENLGPERFQEVCHALLVRAFPKTQCFPVGQRDGGRDAISYLDEGSDGFVVYQVKYVRRPHAEQDPHRWLTEVVREEAPKVRELIPKGAKQYLLLTNVPGTAHPESGSIDSVKATLAANIPVSADCWWRDDVNRRLDDSWNIKWSYPEILSGPDVLRYIVQSGLHEHAERRTSAIRAYIRDQYDRETQVRFKQVELQNRLLDLFIDVPVELREAFHARSLRKREFVALRTVLEEQRKETVEFNEDSLGTATLLLHRLGQENFSQVVIEGGPGQGKSTLVQYICQIHRQRILNEALDDSRIPDEHRHSPVRLPLKVDCRDLSLWLGKENPFGASESESVPATWQKSLESFLAAQIQHHSGGVSFDIADLHAVARLSSLLLVFDGLDEVADIGRRRDVVDYINKGVNRLRESAVTLQTMVTSRPAAFANSPGLPEDTFRYLTLASINRPLIENYAEKWLRARRLDGKEAADVRKILRDKLDQPHLRELARNPMQLAILLSLIQTQGGSLPEKRTALYDSYVQLYFNRESEKSTVVRDNRQLLINIQGHLAWILHAEAQTKRERGAIRADHLRDLVIDYLRKEEHDTSPAEQLFTGMVERVGALVSRVEGTYEFEIQPLREYFAARHLYDTAPYSPPGSPKSGTLPDRFDALSRDFYWLNVTRFYAGCYNRGELPSLVDRLEELSRAPGYRNTGHPFILAATLLSDWVFAQHPKSMKQVVAMVLDGGLRHITSGSRWGNRNEPLVLPKQSGNEELVDRCFELLGKNTLSDYAMMLVELIRANASRNAATDKWRTAVREKKGSERTRWIRYALLLGILPTLQNTELEELIAEDSDTAERLMMLVRGGQRRFVESDNSRLAIAIDYLLSRNSEGTVRRGSSVIDAFSQAIDSHRYAAAFQHRSPLPLSKLLSRTQFLEEPHLDKEADHPSSELADQCKELISVSQRLAERATADWATQLDPWESLVQRGRELFGDRWAFYILANVSAGIKSKTETCEHAAELHDSTVPLCARVRYARLRAGTSSWWEAQLKAANGHERVAFSLLILFTWGGPTIFTKHAGLVDQKLRTLDAQWWARLYAALRSFSHFGPERREMEIDLSSLPATVSARMLVTLSKRLGSRAAELVFKERLASYEGNDRIVLDFCQHSAVAAALEDPASWEKWLPIISRSYRKGAVSQTNPRRFMRAVSHQPLPRETAEEIVKKPEAYPADLVAFAELSCRQYLAEEIVPVGAVAEAENWFGL